MTRRLMSAALATAVGISSAATTGAHEDYRIIGTIAAVSATTLDVKQAKDGKTIGMDMDDTTVVTRDRTKVTVKELKPGLRVVVDARGDSLEELLIVAVRIVPSTARK